MQLSQTRAASRRISLTPLIDVVFLLLVFFMLSSTFLKYTAIDIKGGQAGAGTGDISNLVLVRIHQENKIEVNGQNMTLDNVRRHLEGMASDGKLRIVVKPMEGATVQDVVNVIEQTRSAVASDVTVVK